MTGSLTRELLIYNAAGDISGKMRRDLIKPWVLFAKVRWAGVRGGHPWFCCG